MRQTLKHFILHCICRKSFSSMCPEAYLLLSFSFLLSLIASFHKFDAKAEAIVGYAPAELVYDSQNIRFHVVDWKDFTSCTDTVV